MEILALSLNHRVTPLAVREQVVFSSEDGECFVSEVKEGSGAVEAALISTCNRTELYTVSKPGAGEDAESVLLDMLSKARGFVATEEPSNYEVRRDEGAVRHLFRVASGLDSQILGESQILGQVKTALQWAQAAGTAGRVIHRLWERALRVGKRVRSETALGEGALSASYAALELARKIFGTLRGKHVLVVGTGEIGLLALKNLQGVPLNCLTIMNRTRSRAEELKQRFGGEVRDFDELCDALVSADLVISSTSAQEHLVRYEDLKRVRQQRGGNRPLLIIDLAVPRDFEERCGTLDEVFLKNLGDLSEIVKSNTAERQREIPRAEAFVDGEVASFFDWLKGLDVEPIIRKLRELFHGIRLEELESVRNALGEEAFQEFDQLTRRLVNRLLHVPSENLRRHQGLRDPGFLPLVQELLIDEVPHPKEQAESKGE